MESVGVNVIETAALGRPFQLGMLYDCRKDELIPGITLWDPEKLEQSLRVRPQINTDFKVAASDSIEDKSSLLNINGSLKLSVLGGLVNVSGAAKYFKDTKKSFKQERLTLHYHSTSRFEELTMSHLAVDNISYKGVFENDMATHVVTAVLYGADACFVFDREVSADEEKKTVEGEAKLAYDKLKVVSIGLDGKFKMNDTEKTAVQKFTCTFYGDFQLPSNPTSFEDAVKVFSDLPKLLGEKNELAVPLRVWLYPLDKLHTGASKLQKDISIYLIQETELMIEKLNEAEMKCSDLLKDSPAQSFKIFSEKIVQMKQNCNKYKLRLIERLKSLLPNIRGNVNDETALSELLQEHEDSPFSNQDLSEWLKGRERESNVMKSFLRQLGDAGAQAEDNLEDVWMDLEDKNLVIYTFTSLNYSDELLLQQKVYLETSAKAKHANQPKTKQTSWFKPDSKKTMKNNLQIFKKLIELNDSESHKFIVSSREVENNPGSCILLYEDDDLVHFTPPSKPSCPIIEEATENTLVLKVSPPCPATLELRLLYKLKQDSVWTHKPVLKDEDTVTLTGLISGAEYEVKCAALGKLNYTVDSDATTVTMQGRKKLEHCGLTTLGATSYLNAVLQTLYMTREYRERVLRMERGDDSSDGDFIDELKALFKNLSGMSSPVSTDEISESLNITDVYEHKDAAEYLQLILSKTPDPSKIFKGAIRISVECPSCKSVAKKKRVFSIISLLAKKATMHVRKRMQQRICKLSEVQLQCHKCSETTSISHGCIDWPEIQIVQMAAKGADMIRNDNGFEDDEDGEDYTQDDGSSSDEDDVNDDEDYREVVLPFIKPSSHIYELCAVINLLGSLTDGHYSADVRFDDQKWYRCDDNRVFPVPDRMIRKTPKCPIIMDHPPTFYSSRTPPAYLLFYKRTTQPNSSVKKSE